MKLLCANCQIELRCKKNGVNVLTMSHQPFPAKPSPYQFYAADLYRCPGCGAEVVAGFGQRPIAEHYQDGFAEKVSESPALFHDYERIEDVP